VSRVGRGAALALALGLVAIGAVGGVALDRLVLRDDRAHRGPPRDPDAIAARYRDRLGLDDAQTEAIRTVLHARRKEFDAIMTRVDPDLDRIRGEIDAKIREVLRPDQRAGFDAIVREEAERRAAFRKGLPPPR
jgi:hypothetical protein